LRIINLGQKRFRGHYFVRTALGAALWCLLLAAPAQATISYRVSVENPGEHLFRVSMTVPAVDDELLLQVPAWNGTYQIRDFASRVQNVRATTGNGESLPVRKLDKLTWRVHTGRSLHRVQIEYSTYWDDGGPFSAQLNDQHGFANLALLLMYVPARQGEETEIEFTGLPAGWKTAIALKRNAAGTAWVAPGYVALVDAPVELGPFDEWNFEANGAKLRVVVHGTGYDREKITDMLRHVVSYQTTLMREVPFENYTFLYHLGSGSGGGGMEHAHCTAIHSNSTLPTGVSAHEFFHLWNVKRIRPQSLEPVDFTRENWTRALWFAEGVTSSYGSYTLVRSGLWTAQQYYADLADEFSVLQGRPARLWKSVEEASLDAWHEKYPLYGRAPFSISYYNKGQIVGVLLDILIREASANRRSLDDVLRDLNTTYAHRGLYYPESAGIRASAEKIVGRSFAEFFERYVAGTDELPYADILKRAGLLVSSSGNNPARYEITEDPKAGDLARRIREGLLKGTTDQ